MNRKEALSIAAHFACAEGDVGAAAEFAKNGGESPRFACTRGEGKLREFLEWVGLARRPATTMQFIASRSKPRIRSEDSAAPAALTPTDYALIYAARHGAEHLVDDAARGCGRADGCIEATAAGADIAWQAAKCMRIAAMCETIGDRR